jgi:sugar lactone lactonase YvrE
MEREIKLFAACPCRLSESPMWNDQDKMLYWRGLDGEIFRKKEKTAPNEYERFDLGIGSIGSGKTTGFVLPFLNWMCSKKDKPSAVSVIQKMN